jgi:hypothetical protein
MTFDVGQFVRDCRDALIEDACHKAIRVNGGDSFGTERSGRVPF